MDRFDDVHDAILSENMELFMELFQVQDDDSLWNNIHLYLNDAINTGNMEILNVIIEKWPFEEPIYCPRSALWIIPYLSHNEDKKLEMLKALLLKFHPKDPNWPDFYSINDLFEIIVGCCSEENLHLVEFFINNFYSEKYNSHYALIKKLEAAVDKWQHIGILLHDGIDYSSNHHIYTKFIDISLKNMHFQKVSETFLQLLKNGTRESMDLAVEAFQVLVGMNCLAPFEYWTFLRFGFIWENEQTLDDPSITKLSFKLIYNSINDKTQENIYKIIDSWVRICQDCAFYPRLCIRFAMQAVYPFIQKPLQKLVPDRYHTSSEQNDIFSLQKFCRDVIQCQVYQNVNNVKEYMDRIWSLNLPTTVKCFLLDISDASWMDIG